MTLSRLGQGAAQAQERAYEWGWGMHPMWGVWGAWGVAMAVMMLLFWGVVIVGIVPRGVIRRGGVTTVWTG